MQLPEAAVVDAIQKNAHTLHGFSGVDTLLDRIGNARIVLLGSPSPGTHEYFVWRCLMTRELIARKGFTFIATEGDWAEAERINKSIQLVGDAKPPRLLLQEFRRWPPWVNASWEMVAMMEWLQKLNEGRLPEQRIGFYGLDAYGLWESTELVMKYLKRVQPHAVRAAKEAFTCFEPFRREQDRTYPQETQLIPEQWAATVVNILTDSKQKVREDEPAGFGQTMHTNIAENAEVYYRCLMKGGADAWNIRTQHLGDMLIKLLKWHGDDAKAVVWAHDSQVGDARATSMASEGMYSLGELLRVRGVDVALIGLGSYRGTVTAARNWGGTARVLDLPAARRGSWEYLLHRATEGDSMLFMEDLKTREFLENYIDHRAVGMVYNPDFEMYGNYVPSILPMRYDAYLHFDRTAALHALHLHPHGLRMPAAYPFGL